jgi:FHS family glucose/mannose:H+ symporter-like MFS transporter
MRAPAFFALACYAFVSLGISAALQGPLLPTLAARANVGLEQIGVIFTWMSLGYILSAPLINTIGARIGLRGMLLTSPLVVIASMALLALSDRLEMLFLGGCLLGLGQSGTQVAYNTLFGAQSGARSDTARLNRLNAFFGLGALIGPLFVSASYILVGDGRLAPCVAAAMALPLTIGAIAARQVPSRSGTAPAGHNAKRLLASPVAWALCLVMALYVGCEVAFSGWTAEFTRRAAGTSAAQAATAVSVFWAALAFSRYCAPVALMRLSPIQLIGMLFGVSVLGLIVMLMAQQVSVAAWLGAALVGVGLGPIYPTLVAIGIQQFPFAARMITSALTSVGAVGALFIPALTGVAMESGAAAGTEAWLLLIGVLLIMLALWGTMRRGLRLAPASQ